MAKFLCLLAVVLACIIDASSAQTLRSIAEKQHRYIGAAFAMNYIDTDPTYAEVFPREFDCVTAEWNMKWAEFEKVRGVKTYEECDKIVAYAEKHNMKIRGHTLLWHQEVPDWVEHGNFNASALREVVKEHITNEVTRWKGKIFVWDVVNEVIEDGTSGKLRESVFKKTLGKEFIAEAFKAAHEADPAAKLYINDYAVETANPKSDALYALVKELKAGGAPVHGVGFQAHMWLEQTEVQDDFQKILEKFAALDVDVAITELDVSIPMPFTTEKQQKQAEQYRKVVDACVNVPRCVGITTWGFTDKYSWIPDFTKNDAVKRGQGLPFDEHYKEKPAYTAIKTSLSKGVKA